MLEAVAETGARLEQDWSRDMGKFTLGLGLGVGYVLGARAGRAQYEQIKRAAAGFMERPEVQQALEKARTAAPAPLQSSIDKLSGRGSGGAGTGADAVVVQPATLESSGVVTPPPPVSDAGGLGQTDAPLPDPLTPPAKSGVQPPVVP